ncbi:MAG: hypothetical protein VYB23_03165, partial [Candidatus Thermoplasmatota archaeon]|nr:hypothetical protein [Candidatus Thermoplasmatota archaeon]
QIDVIATTIDVVESSADGRAVMFAVAGGTLVVVLLALNAIMARRRRISDVDLIASWGVLQQDKVAPEITNDVGEADEVEVDESTDDQPVGGGFDWDAV